MKVPIALPAVALLLVLLSGCGSGSIFDYTGLDRDQLSIAEQPYIDAWDGVYKSADPFHRSNFTAAQLLAMAYTVCTMDRTDFEESFVLIPSQTRTTQEIWKTARDASSFAHPIDGQSDLCSTTLSRSLTDNRVEREVAVLLAQ